MKRFLTVALVGVMALGLTSTVYANLCAFDPVPASTLLFPFVVYDYEQGDVDNSGQTTLFAITNVSADAQIVHVTVWSDYSIAILDFNVLLTGYDVQTMNIRDILRDGNLPMDTLWVEDAEGNSPFADGPYSPFNELFDGDLDPYFVANGLPDPVGTWDGVSTGLGAVPLDCDPEEWLSSPNNYTGGIDDNTIGLFRTYLQASQTADKWYAQCVYAQTVPPFDPQLADDDPDNALDFDGVWFTDGHESGAVWMYITADIVGACNKDLPDSDWVNYFATVNSFGIQIANVLMGDVIYLDSGNNYSEADNAVHLEAAPFGFGTPAGSGKPSTFYHRFHGSDPTLWDGREPLATAWGMRYMISPANSAATWFRAWKGTIDNGLAMDLSNGSYNLNPDELFANSCTPYTYYAWDEDENANSVQGSTPPPWSGGDVPQEPIPVPNLFPLETQEVNADQFFVVDPDGDGTAFGWIMFIWPRSNTVDGAGADYSISDQYQTWMGAKYAAFGQYTAGLSGAVLGNYNCFSFQTLPNGLGIGTYSE